MAPKSIAELLGLGKANISVSDGQASKTSNGKQERKQEKKTDDTPKETPKKKNRGQNKISHQQTSHHGQIQEGEEKEAVQQRPLKGRKHRQCRVQRKRGE